jgi:hypothetical protein
MLMPSDDSRGCDRSPIRLTTSTNHQVDHRKRCDKSFVESKEIEVAKKATKKLTRREYTKADVKELRAHSKARTPLAGIVKLMKRTEGSLRQKALKLGIGLGHQR